MSYSAHRRDALDPSVPFPHRASHARSCTVRVSQKFHVPRDLVLDCVLRETGVDLRMVRDANDLERAMAALDRIRFEGLGLLADA